jgi:hypothetical protein
MGRNSKPGGPNKAVLWVIVGIVGVFTFFGAMVLVLVIMAFRSKETTNVAKSTPPQSKAGPLAKTKGASQKGTNIGNIAIEIEGEDIDGKTFKLSEYKGKVVMLDFWGFW